MGNEGKMKHWSLKEWSFPFGVNTTVLITKVMLLIKLTAFVIGSTSITDYVIVDFIESFYNKIWTIFFSFALRFWILLIT